MHWQASSFGLLFMHCGHFIKYIQIQKEIIMMDTIVHVLHTAEVIAYRPRVYHLAVILDLQPTVKQRHNHYWKIVQNSP